ncbi:MAG: DUF7678 domain-containing protein [Thermoguttaceae bacterium]
MFTNEERIEATWTLVDHTKQKKLTPDEVAMGVHLWRHGTYGPFGYSVKVGTLPSIYGIREGRILKLELRVKANNEIVASYEGDWDILPDDTTDTKAAVICEVIDIIVEHYNVPKTEQPVSQPVEK